ncbi:MAG: GGDEF domain-containing protein [Lachnospiraceae bacterium]|nr:GGDEF domain-containing protein [Lachnospiraceae bacterium]
MGQKKKIIAVCGAQLYEEKEFSFLSRLHKAANKLGYVIMAFNLSLDPLKSEDEIMNEDFLIEMIGKFDCSALIIMSESIKTPELRKKIRDSVEGSGMPVFSIDRELDDCINIVSDYGDGFKDMVRHVIVHHGSRKVNMIAGIKGNEFSEERVQAYKEALTENNIPFEEKRLAYGDFWDRPAREAANAFLDSGDIPDAIVCANDTMAISACSVLRERGFNVPEDVIVTGFDGIMSARLNYPPISTVAPDYSAMVEVIMEHLVSIEAGNPCENGHTHHINFIVRENRSCGCGTNDESLTSELINKLSYAFNDQKWQAAAMNYMLLSTADKQHIQELAPLLRGSVEMWMENFYYIGVHSELMNYRSDAPVTNTYTSLFRMEHSEFVTTGEQYDPSVAVPDFDRLLEEDDGYSLFMVRLLFTDINVYGYLVTGFYDIDIRTLRRTDEFGLFVSTAISEILKNVKIFWFNERLKQLNREMERAAVHDPLTGLYNRRGFYDELSRISMASVGRYITFFSIDMDGLKQINDNYGHNEGDIAISSIADAIRHFSARNGICARFGGDEFVCALITDTPLFLSPDTVRARISSVISRQKALAGKPYTVSASVGYECMKIDTLPDFDAVMRKADEMMYEDKRARKKERAD